MSAIATPTQSEQVLTALTDVLDELVVKGYADDIKVTDPMTRDGEPGVFITGYKGKRLRRAFVSDAGDVTWNV